MIIDNTLADDAVLVELGRRLARQRIAQALTQAQLAKQAGIGKRTLERMEAGESSQLLTLIRVLRVLDGLAAIEQWLPDASQSPMARLRSRDGGSVPQRVRAPRIERVDAGTSEGVNDGVNGSVNGSVNEEAAWHWDDDA